MKKFLIFLLVLAIPVAAVGGFFLHLKNGFEKDMIAEGRGEYVEVEFEIGKNDYPRTVCDNLRAAGIIRYNQNLYEYIKETGTGPSIQNGTFKLNSGMTYDEILEVITKPQGRKADLWVTIPEGTTLLKAAEIVAETTGLCTAEEFLDVANNGDFSKYSWWNAIPTDGYRFMRGEGYLLPDTYNFYNDSSVYELVDRFYSAFDAYVAESVTQEKLDALGMTLDDIIVLASMVQEEAGNEQDAMVSSVFHNRLRDGWKLESNASSYIKNDADNNYVHNWLAPYYGGWTLIPEGMAEAYDTYAVAGLPAGPISNPGRAAIEAALNPAESDYFFFVTDPEGNYYYGVTADEHYANCVKAGLY
ncbi:MAG: endolytic transglycosylase MltG [Oscillospiraceae bacterium]|nr:endolytic transglycosylase MltG [Oscillospiraceae bacterium]